MLALIFLFDFNLITYFLRKIWMHPTLKGFCIKISARNFTLWNLQIFMKQMIRLYSYIKRKYVKKIYHVKRNRGFSIEFPCLSTHMIHLLQWNFRFIIECSCMQIDNLEQVSLLAINLLRIWCIKTELFRVCFPRGELDHVNIRTWGRWVALKTSSPQASFRVLVSLTMMLPI